MIKPCWPVEVCDDCCTEALEQLTPEQLEALSDLAAFLIWKATGGRLGLCETTYRPCRIECGTTGGLPTPQRVNGDWLNISCGSCRGKCRCDFISGFIIPNVHQVVRVPESLCDRRPRRVVDHRHARHATSGWCRVHRGHPAL